MSEGKPHKHHYIPSFYLKRWAGTDKQICEFSRPFGTKIVTRRKHPNATGFKDGLYTLRGYEPEIAQQIEENFFKVTDQLASDALDKLEVQGGRGKWSLQIRSAWSRFLLSLSMRAPEDIAVLRSLWEWVASADDDSEARYAEAWRPGDPLTFRDYMLAQPDSVRDQYLFEIFPPLIDHDRIGKMINNLDWGVLNTTKARYELLTSDRPVIRTQPFGSTQGHIAIPIGPRKLFVCSGERNFMNGIVKANVHDLVEECNKIVVGQAVNHVYGRTESQLRFIHDRFGSQPATRLLEITANRARRHDRVLAAAMGAWAKGMDPGGI